MENLDSRLERLERSYRRMQAVALTALALAGLGLAAAVLKEEGHTGELVVSRLTLKDAHGRVRATLSANADGDAGLVLTDSEGRPRA